MYSETPPLQKVRYEQFRIWLAEKFDQFECVHQFALFTLIGARVCQSLHGQRLKHNKMPLPGNLNQLNGKHAYLAFCDGLV
jgi:hypothetical protein